MEETKISFKKFLPGFAWFFIVALLTLMPGKDVPKVSWLNIPNLDKIVHIFLFGFLTLFFLLPYFKIKGSIQTKKNIFKKLALSIIIWGLIIEIMQEAFVSGRGFEWLDLFADTIGVLGAYWLSLSVIKSKSILQKIPFF